MISVIMPYWKRPRALEKTLENYEELYDGRDDLEIVVVDDGSPTAKASEVILDSRLDVVLVEMPVKNRRRNPVSVWNKGVDHSQGDVIALSNPEVTHRGDVIAPMLERLREVGGRGYVFTRVFSPDDGRWEIPNTCNRPAPYFSMMTMDFYLSFGGMDETYRDGHAFDDDDLILTLEKAGAQFCFMPDLVVEHHIERSGGRDHHDEAGFRRNQKIFHDKWGGRTCNDLPDLFQAQPDASPG